MSLEHFVLARQAIIYCREHQAHISDYLETLEKLDAGTVIGEFGTASEAYIALIRLSLSIEQSIDNISDPKFTHWAFVDALIGETDDVFAELDAALKGLQ